MKLKKIISLGVFLIILSNLVGCNVNTTGELEKAKPVVAVSIVPQKTFVEKVAGDLVDIVTMIPPGYSPETYQPSPKEMRELSNASVYFSLGVPSEDSILPEIKDFNKDIKVVKLDDEIEKVYPHRYFDEEEHGEEHEEHNEDEEHHHHHGGKDPHIWMSPKRVKIMINVISEKLSEIDPNNKEIYEKNAQDYIEELDVLDKEIKEMFSGVKNKSFIMYHPALGYFADDYGLEMIAIEDEGKEATAKRLQGIIDIAKEKNIKVVFYQAEVDSKQSRTLAGEIGGIAQKVAPLSPDYINNLRSISQTIKGTLD